MINDKVKLWARIFDNEYNKIDADDFINNFSVWKKFYDNKPFLKEDLEEWASNSINKINYILRRDSAVLEIGCGNGLFPAYLNNKCSKYTGIDSSLICIERLKKYFKSNEKFDFCHKEAVCLEIDNNKYDIVIINSASQYFPNIEYFLKVLHISLSKLNKNGAIFIGDVRSLIHTWYLEKKFKSRYKNPDKFFKLENETLYNPGFFHLLPYIFKDISLVKVDLKRGIKNNELSRYRFDVFIFKNNFDVLHNNLKNNDLNDFYFKNGRLQNLKNKLAASIENNNNFLINNFDGSYYLDYDLSKGLDAVRLSTFHFIKDNMDINSNLLLTNKCVGMHNLSLLKKIFN